MLRREMRRRKKGVCASEAEREAALVFAQLGKMQQFQSAQTILAYWALPDELPTRSFILHTHGRKRVLLPAVRGDELVLHPFEGEDRMRPVPPFGILEPEGKEIVSPEEVDLVIVPGVAFSPAGHRLGRGKGFYDRLFPRMPHAVRVGVCLRTQLVDEVPFEPHDTLMDAVITAVE